MAAAKFLDTVARMPGMGGQAADAVKDYTQVPLKKAHQLLGLPLNNVLKHGYRSQNHDNRHHGQALPIQYVLLSGTSTVTLSLDCFGNDT